MGIRIQEEERLFSLETKGSLYQMKADEAGILLHLFYGPATGEDMGYLLRSTVRGFAANPYELQNRLDYSPDLLPQEYSTKGSGDFRTPAAEITLANGSSTTDWRYAGYRRLKGKEKPAGLPGVRGSEQTEGLEITLEDRCSGLKACLLYYVFEAQDVIVRSVRIENHSDAPVTIRKAASACIDFPYGSKEVLHFYGRHAMERLPGRSGIPQGGQLTFESRRGMSSHQSNPFVILCDPAATERQGECWGFMLMYSGNHLEEVSLDQTGSVRLVSGIHPEGFSWKLAPGACFQTPEAILSYSGEGLNALSRNYHRLIRDEVIAPRWRQVKKPVLVNSWEASYFNFNAESLLSLGRSARDLGIEMLVLDDGWFGKRNDDSTSLGDWICNEEKLGCSLQELSERIHALDLKFGLWVEPEMVSMDSDLYRRHPDWALADPDRNPAVSRHQLVLDMGREDVRDYLFETLGKILKDVRIEYVKWDFNRSVVNCYSRVLPEDRQGEAAHRFMLGTYDLLERLVTAFPEVMIEGCSGGGGRFDAGMLYYCPQIWCSDNTDAIERLEIQRGTSYGYPVCTMGAHVSACPNHQTGRTVPLETRGITAMAGTFGYELDPGKLTEKEKETVKAQIAAFHRFERLIASGDYYRLDEAKKDETAWIIVSADRREALLSVVTTHTRANGPFPLVRLQGLDAQQKYRREDTGEIRTGAAWMYGGISFPQANGDYPAVQVYFSVV